MDLDSSIDLLGYSSILSSVMDYRSDLLRFNAAIPLVSRRDTSIVVDRLILESLAAARALTIPAGDRVLDLGTGAGIPGIPLALARGQGGASVSLLDRRTGHCDFVLREVRRLGLSAEVLPGSAESWGRHPDHYGAYQWVTLKAVRTPPVALGLARPFLSPAGRAVLFRDSSWRPPEEVASSGWILEDQRDLKMGGVSPAAIFLFRLAA